MSTEEFQKLVLEKLIKIDGLEKGQKRLEEGQGRLESNVDELKKDMREVKRDLKSVWSDILTLDNRLCAQEETVRKLAK
jgi:peptidoglycan hydrolase CwlO-like protein